MGSTDRPGGGVERPEHGDRPLSDAERIDRYEKWVDEHFSQPENRDKLDPFTHMTSGEIKRLYLPDRTEVPPSGSIRVDGQEPKRPARSDMPYAEIEGDRARLIDPARDTPQTPGRDDVKPQADRMGDRILEESDEKSRFERFRKEGYEVADDAVDSTKKYARLGAEFFEDSRPTGHAETRADQPMAEPRRDGIDAGDAITSAALAGVLLAEATWRGVRHWRSSKEGT